MRVRPLRALLSLLVLGVVAGLVALNACGGPLRIDPLQNATGPALVDEDLELARTYAPWIFHAVHPTKGRQDLLAPVDFDGDLNGENNWESFPRYELIPTVYYACVESPTHRFLTYHLFHPRDWTHFDVGLHLTHEGDGENLQVVVEKETGRVVLLYAQAHYRGLVYANEYGGLGDGSERIRGKLLLLDDAGKPAPLGTHAAVFVESGGHGIYGSEDGESRVGIGEDGGVRFHDPGMVLRPARLGERTTEPELGTDGSVPYRLESTTAKLWPGVRDGSLVGEGKLLDGTVRYADERVRIDLPRYHEANRFSGPFGSDRGISPFAVDFGFSEGDLGALFFDPARRYAECLSTPAGWGTELVSYPYGG